MVSHRPDGFFEFRHELIMRRFMVGQFPVQIFKKISFIEVSALWLITLETPDFVKEQMAHDQL